MIVSEVTIKIFMTRDLAISEIQGALNDYIDGYLVKKESFQKFHETNRIKAYNFDLPAPVPKETKVYAAEHIYQFRIRTVDPELLAYLLCGIADHKTDAIKGLTRTVRQIPRKPIAKIFSLTPVVLKDAGGRGYWRDCMTFFEFEEELKKSMIHQYEAYTGERLDAGLALYDQIELKSKCAVAMPYKGVTLLGDKLSMQVADNETAQKAVYFALANGLATMGARGAGFLGYRFL